MNGGPPLQIGGSEERDVFEALTFVPEGLFGCIVTLPDSLSHSYKGAPDLSSMDLGSKQNVYVAVGLAPKDFGPHKRCPASQVAGIRGLWADVDVAGDDHKKPNLPPTREAALSLIGEMPEPPTFIIHSGHGLQAWWMLPEPWVFADDADREKAKALTLAWHEALLARAQAHGWTVDAVHDLARIMRLPGTTNYKGEPVPVTVHLNGGPVYDREVLAALVVREPQAESPTVSVEIRETEPPQDKLALLLAANEKFANSWRRDRPDLADQSPSGYDMSLATIAAERGWTDQEIADLLVKGRREHGDDLKKADYYARTIGRARQANNAPEDLQGLGEESGVTLLRFIKLLSEPPSYRLETGHGPVLLSMDDILNQARFRCRFAETTNVLLTKVDGATWDKRVRTLLASVVTESVGAEATVAGRTLAWLEDYMDERAVSDDAGAAVITKSPFMKDGHIYIFSEELRKWLYVKHPPAPDPKELAKNLWAVGAEPVQGRFGGRKCRVWRLRHDPRAE